MDNAKNYRKIIKNVIQKYANLRPSHGNIRLDPIFDETNDRYVLMQTGWDKGHRVRGNLIYLALEGEKICVEYDGLEHGIMDDLIKGGVPEDKIFLAYMSEPKNA